MKFRRMGAVAGQDKAGRLCMVSVYRDGAGYKLCGPTGSRIVDGTLATIHQAAADAYSLADATFLPSTRAA